MEPKRGKERFFSVELRSKSDLKSVSIPKRSHENVLVEGSIGELLQLGFTEGIVFEIVGEKGVLRVDIGEDEVTKAIMHESMKNSVAPRKRIATIRATGGEMK